MLLRFYTYTLEFKHPFAIAHGVRSTTPVVFTEIECDGIVGYGEASMPPYLGESHETATLFLNSAAEVIKKYHSPNDIGSIMNSIDGIKKNNCAAKAAVDIALYDLKGKINGTPCYKMFNADKQKAPFTSYTIGIDTPEALIQKVKEAEEYKILKVKLGGSNDKEMISTIRGVTNKPISVDVNQGWKERELALDMIHWLTDKNVLFIEQPLPKNRLDDVSWLAGKSKLPLIADEDVQRYEDIDKVKNIYHGVNIKLMKCTGMFEAHKMIVRAREHGMKILIGCMSETLCAISAAAQLSPLCDWADLDGPLLIKNNCFNGVKFESGKIVLSDLPGNGVSKF